MVLPRASRLLVQGGHLHALVHCFAVKLSEAEDSPAMDVYHCERSIEALALFVNKSGTTDGVAALVLLALSSCAERLHGPTPCPWAARCTSPTQVMRILPLK